MHNDNPTLREALQMYCTRVSIHKKGHEQEKYRIGLYSRYPIADMPVRSITSVHIAEFRDARLAEINAKTKRTLSTSTVRLDLALLSNMFHIGRIEWGICDDNPVANVRKPKPPPGRDRRLTTREERMIMKYCVKHKTFEMKAIVQLALETGMRQGEIHMQVRT